MADVLALKRRRDIHQFISDYPGVYFNEIKDKLHMNTGVCQHHLLVLEKMELISSELEGSRKRYFIRDTVPYLERKLLALVRLKSNRDILIYILMNRIVRFQQISHRFSMSKATTSYHMKKLVEYQLVSESMMEREKSYIIREPDVLAKVLITYKSSFLDEAVDRFIELWEGL